MKVTENVYALDSTKGNYAYVVLDKELVLIDTGLPKQGNGILKELKSMNIKPEDIKHILITHHDLDHIGNLALLEKETGASIWASEEDIHYILGNKSRPGIKKLFSFISRIKKPENINSFPEEQRIGNIEVIPTPGHTPGHVCLLYNDALFVGDLVENSKGELKPLASFMNWNISLLRESISKVNQLSFKWVCTAHGEPIERDTLEQ